MITSLYASLCALLLIKLSLNVISLRRQHKVRLGDGGVDELQAAIRAHGNAIEYIPIALILMLVLELSGGYWWLIHLAGIILLAARLLHVSALQNNHLQRRVLGMKMTIFLIISLSIVNIGLFVSQQFV
jgi:uncharacterized membrane protein YecN with MAPEG domain